MSTVPTVRVKRDGPKGYHIINQSDFDPAKHKLWEAGAKKDEAKKSDEPLKTPAEVLAMADAEGVHFMTFKAEAKKLLGDALADDAKKADIIAALKAASGE